MWNRFFKKRPGHSCGWHAPATHVVMLWMSEEGHALVPLFCVRPPGFSEDEEPAQGRTAGKRRNEDLTLGDHLILKSVLQVAGMKKGKPSEEPSRKQDADSQGASAAGESGQWGPG